MVQVRIRDLYVVTFFCLFGRTGFPVPKRFLNMSTPRYYIYLRWPDGTLGKLELKQSMRLLMRRSSRQMGCRVVGTVFVSRELRFPSPVTVGSRVPRNFVLDISSSTKGPLVQISRPVRSGTFLPYRCPPGVDR